MHASTNRISRAKFGLRQDLPVILVKRKYRRAASQIRNPRPVAGNPGFVPERIKPGVSGIPDPLQVAKAIRLGKAKTIVVTHHAPSALSLPEHRRDKTLSCAYASHLDDFILRHQPSLWIHGHIHTPCDYRIGATRILSNTHGYITEGACPGFRPDLVVEV